MLILQSWAGSKLDFGSLTNLVLDWLQWPPQPSFVNLSINFCFDGHPIFDIFWVSYNNYKCFHEITLWTFFLFLFLCNHNFQIEPEGIRSRWKSIESQCTRFLGGILSLHLIWFEKFKPTIMHRRLVSLDWKGNLLVIQINVSVQINYLCKQTSIYLVQALGTL